MKADLGNSTELASPDFQQASQYHHNPNGCAVRVYCGQLPSADMRTASIQADNALKLLDTLTISCQSRDEILQALPANAVAFEVIDNVRHNPLSRLFNKPEPAVQWVGYEENIGSQRCLKTASGCMVVLPEKSIVHAPLHRVASPYQPKHKIASRLDEPGSRALSNPQSPFDIPKASGWSS